jgi:hypothetical protein
VWFVDHESASTAADHVASLSRFPSRSVLHTTGTNAGLLVQPEALGVLDRPETMWNARLLWPARDDTFVEIHAMPPATAAATRSPPLANADIAVPMDCGAQL